MTLSINDTQLNNALPCADECCILLNIMLSNIMLSVVMLSVVASRNLPLYCSTASLQYATVDHTNVILGWKFLLRTHSILKKGVCPYNRVLFHTSMLILVFPRNIRFGWYLWQGQSSRKRGKKLCNFTTWILEQCWYHPGGNVRKPYSIVTDVCYK
jgi:hypothetical protein